MTSPGPYRRAFPWLAFLIMAAAIVWICCGCAGGRANQGIQITPNAVASAPSSAPVAVVAGVGNVTAQTDASGWKGVELGTVGVHTVLLTQWATMMYLIFTSDRRERLRLAVRK